MGIKQRPVCSRSLRSGFTIVEMLVAGVVSMFVGMVILNVYQSTSKSLSMIYDQGTFQLNLNNSMSLLNNDIHLARIVPVAGGGGTTLEVKVPSIVGGQPSTDINIFDTITYDLINGSQLRRTLAPNALSSRTNEQQILATRLFFHPSVPPPLFTVSTPAGQTNPVVNVALTGMLSNDGQIIGNGKLTVNGKILARNILP